MTVYRKCRPCKFRDDCEIKSRLSAAIKGFGVGVIAHRCKKYTPDFARGDNVWVRTNDVPHPSDYVDDAALPTKAVFPAHFVEYSKTLGRAIVYIAPGAKSQCGEYKFVPANDKAGFCKVSYAPYRAKFKWSGDRGIIDRREGRTAITCHCGVPAGTNCTECQRHQLGEVA
jgi:hypothetical protein